MFSDSYTFQIEKEKAKKPILKFFGSDFYLAVFCVIIKDSRILKNI